MSVKSLIRRGVTALVAFSLVALVALGCSASDTMPANQRFLVASDIHFNPFYDPSLTPRLAKAAAAEWDGVFASSTVTGLGTYGADTSWPLLTSSLAAMKAALPDPAFVLISGDVLAHHFPQLYDTSMPSGTTTMNQTGYQSFVAKTVAYLAAKLRETYPEASIIVALGNNDDDCGDYEIQPGGAFLSTTGAAIKGLIKEPVGPDFDASWAALGNFVVPHPTLKGVRMVAVNTVYLSPRYQNACGISGGSGPTPATATLDWLSGVLADAKAAGEKVWLLQHVPPGIDAYSTTSYMTCPSVTTMYAPEYDALYGPLMLRYADTITASFSGHTHMDDFRLIGTGAGASYSLITPAVSPVFEQNPGFRVFDMAPDGALTNQTTHYLSNLATASSAASASWKAEYDFNSAWSVSGVNLSTLQAVQGRIAAGGADQDRYVKYYGVSTTENVGITPSNLKGYVCAAGNAETTAFVSCYCGG